MPSIARPAVAGNETPSVQLSLLSVPPTLEVGRARLLTLAGELGRRGPVGHLLDAIAGRSS